MDSPQETLLHLKRTKPRHYVAMIKRRHPEIWQSIEDFCKNIPNSENFTSPQKIFHWLEQTKCVPCCPFSKTPLPFWDLKFKYRSYSGRGLFTVEHIKQRAKSRRLSPKPTTTLDDKIAKAELHHKDYVFDEAFFNKTQTLVASLLNTTNNTGGALTALSKRKNILHLLFLKKIYPNVGWTERIYRCLHNIKEHPLCPITNKPLPFINTVKGYKPTHPDAAKFLRNQTLQKQKSSAATYPLLTLEETKTLLQTLLNELKAEGTDKKNLKNSALKRYPALIRSVEEHTKHLEFLTNKWSEKAYWCIHQISDLERKQFISFEEGYIDTFCSVNQSRGELEVYNWLLTLLPLEQVVRHHLIEQTLRLQADIFLPQHNVAIEYHGEYYHNYEMRGKELHKKKADISKEQNINLLQIFECEWYNKNDIVKSIILSKLGLISRKIHARKCIVKSVDSATKNNFLSQNHIQGPDRSKVSFGLYYDNELVCLMTFGRSYNQKNHKNSVELVRMCTLLNTVVVGGASKLLKHFIEVHNPQKIHTYADRRFANTSKFYETLGFTKIRITQPNYYYFKAAMPRYIKLMHRYNFAKHKLPSKLKVFDSSKTEYENMKANGYLKIYDAGSYYYELDVR